MAHWSDIQTYIPYVAFLAGLTGSLHCMGMCGGLVTASCRRGSDVFVYQVGRLLGYLALAGAAGFLGKMLRFNRGPSWLSLIPTLVIGGLFIFWGVRSFQGKRAELPAPAFLGKLYGKLWGKYLSRVEIGRSFWVGLISILLPCGLLYGVILGTLATQSVSMAMLGIFFFWLGTVPSMVAAPGILQRILRPLQRKLPKFYAIVLVTIGLSTISWRAYHHFKPHSISDGTSNEAGHSCH